MGGVQSSILGLGGEGSFTPHANKKKISKFGGKKNSNNRGINLNQTNEEIYRFLDPEEEKSPFLIRDMGNPDSSQN